jgi:hypothetical protein
MRRKAKKVWYNKAEAQKAELIVLAIALRIINERIPGDTYTYKRKGRTCSIPKARIISVFRWIVRQTECFKIPIEVNFWHHPAAEIGFCLSWIFHPTLSNELYALEKEGAHVPRFSDFSSGGVWGVMFSNLSRSRGNLGEGLAGVTIINVYSKPPNPTRVVMLDSIPE